MTDERPKVKKKVWKPFRGLEVQVEVQNKADQAEFDARAADAAVIHPRRAFLFLPLLALIVLKLWPGAEDGTLFWPLTGLAAACLAFYWVLRRRDRERAAMPGQVR